MVLTAKSKAREGEQARTWRPGSPLRAWRGDCRLAADDGSGLVSGWVRIEREKGFVDDDYAGGGERGEGVLVVGGDVGVAAGGELVQLRGFASGLARVSLPSRT
jgi:hypothetical protein